MNSFGDLRAQLEGAGIQVPERNTEAKPKSRKAGEELSKAELTDLLTPWYKLEKDPTQPNYVGRSMSRWKEDNSRIRDLLLRNPSKKTRRDILAANGFINKLEQDSIIKNLGKPILHSEDIWVPGAAGDEELAHVLLERSGFDPVKFGNDYDPLATDLRASVDGIPRFIDAQMRTGNEHRLSLGVTRFDRQGRRLYLQNPNEKLANIILMAKDLDRGIAEDKLLHTKDTDFNKIQSRLFRDGGELYEKDMLITSDRPGLADLGYRKGSYNRTQPESWDLVDLNRAREILLQMTPSQLASERINPIRNTAHSQGIKLSVPQEFIRKELQNPNAKLLDRVVDQLSKPYRRR